MTVFHRRSAVLTTALLCVSLFGVSACTVQPLYAPTTVGGSATESIRGRVIVKEATEREEQEIRNHLTFLIDGGKGQPGTADYVATISARSNVAGAFVARADSDALLRVSRRELTMIAEMEIVDSTGTKVKTFTASAMSAYDLSSQESTELRAKRDAVSRTARETAEILYAQLAAWLARGS